MYVDLKTCLHRMKLYVVNSGPDKKIPVSKWALSFMNKGVEFSLIS